ncbi:MAG: NisI/SpaI family lantibiotic immunity lipoprotein [Streptococcaceae bacterium]|nr:NisI/SpaI family lantibiotic immunity lipoprotein [Streptococcaceae bacterium]
MTLLTGCSHVSEVKFRTGSYQNFTYKQTDYSITNTEVAESQITGVRLKFYKLLKVKPEDKNSSVNTLAFNNLYRDADDQLCIGVNDKYFLVLPAGEVASGKTMSLQNFPYTNTDFSIDSHDVRKILSGKSMYRITDQPVAEAELGEYLDTLAETKVFEPKTGKEIPKSEWGKIDWEGTKENDKREEWDYGEIHAIKKTSPNQAFAIEINNEYKRAVLE